MATPLSLLAARVQFGPVTLKFAAAAAVFASVLIIVAGGVVRVTGSGLGCPTWPSCDGENLAATAEMGIHGAIEFGNRLLTAVLCLIVGFLIVVARCQRNPNSSVIRAAWLQFWIVVVNAVVGGITVLARLSPYMVAAHFIAAVMLLTAAVYTYEVIERSEGSAVAATYPDTRLATDGRVLLGGTALLLFVGTGVTGSGIHAGDSADIQRMPFDWLTVTVIHGVIAASVLCYALFMFGRARRISAWVTMHRCRLFIFVFIAQGAVGTLQALSISAEALVVLHMLGAALAWIGAVRILLCTSRLATLNSDLNWSASRVSR